MIFSPAVCVLEVSAHSFPKIAFCHSGGLSFPPPPSRPMIKKAMPEVATGYSELVKEAHYWVLVVSVDLWFWILWNDLPPSPPPPSRPMIKKSMPKIATGYAELVKEAHYWVLVVSWLSSVDLWMILNTLVRKATPPSPFPIYFFDKVIICLTIFFVTVNPWSFFGWWDDILKPIGIFVILRGISVR